MVANEEAIVCLSTPEDTLPMGMRPAEGTPKTYAAGIRCEPRAIICAIVEGTKQMPVLESIDTSKAPTDVEEAECLLHLHSRLQGMLQSLPITAIGVRYPEHIARGGGTASSKARCRVEGVVLLLAQSIGIPVWTGVLRQVGALMCISNPKEQLEAADLRGVSLATYSKPEREAILIAISQLPDGSDGA